MCAEPIELTAENESSSIIVDTRRTRPRFFDGKFLTAADLTQEQTYLLTRQADLGRTLGFGVVEGLRVSRATISASGLPNPAASVKVTRGNGLTPSGEIVFVPNEITIDLDNVAQMQRLSAAFGLTREPQQPFQSLSGLFVLGLRAVEFTANPTPAYPPSVDGNSSLRDGETIEATAFTIVPYDSDASRKDPRSARTRAAREIFLEQKNPSLPAGVLPLAMLFLRNGTLDWTDEWLVRREAGDDDRFGFGFAPRALSEAHFFHYQEMLKETPGANPGQLSAQSFLEIIPASGPLPANAINRTDFTQAWFPPEARVELAFVPADELAALMEDSIDLPPINLALKPEDQDALAILVLAPVTRADFGNTLDKLKTLPPPVLRNFAPPLLAQQKPIEALLKLNAVFELKKNQVSPAPAPADFVSPAWREALSKVDQLWYIRRRNLPSGTGLAGTPLAVASEVITGTDLPPPVSTGGGSGGTNDDDNTETPPVISGKPEEVLYKFLAEEQLWGRFAFFRTISDLPAHNDLVNLLTDPILTDNKLGPLLQQALFTTMENAIPLISESPAENFDQIQKDPGIKVLTQDIIAKARKTILSKTVLRGLEATVAEHPLFLTELRYRQVLGRTDRIATLALITAKYSDLPAYKSLMEVIEKYAPTGRAQVIRDNIDKFIKKVNT
ncbi:MAG: hypothetical protein QM715_19790 [Nibricoccus sp.]